MPARMRATWAQTCVKNACTVAGSASGQRVQVNGPRWRRVSLALLDVLRRSGPATVVRSCSEMPLFRPGNAPRSAMGSVPIKSVNLNSLRWGRTQDNEFRLTDLDGGGCRWRFWMCSEDLDPQRLCDPAPKCHCSVQEMLLGARWGASQSNPLT